jgi:cytochrome c oxidase subunit 2
MFSGASNFAESVDKAFIFIFSIAFVFIIGITSFMIYTLIKFNRKKGKPAKQFSGSTLLEVIWTSVPLIIVLLMFYVGWKGYAPMRKPPADAMPITAIGKMWEWIFDYGNGIRSKNLVVPVNKPIRLDLRSEDVNHSLFIPAFRVKEDVIPGYENFLWFIPTVEGEYEILCTEYCGLLHAGMLTKARVVDQATYEKWFSEQKAEAEKPLPDGFLLLQSTGCLACHSIDGKKLVGPSFKGFTGSSRIINEDGNKRTIVADREYFVKSVFDPDVQIVEGFQKGLMKSYRELLTEENIDVILNYIKTLDGIQEIK